MFSKLKVLEVWGAKRKFSLSAKGLNKASCFEAADAISEQDDVHTKEELGDVILNASMIAYMFEQSGKLCGIYGFFVQIFFFRRRSFLRYAHRT